MAVERREKDGGGGGRGGKDRNLTLVDVYDIAADIGKVCDHGDDDDEEIPSLVDVYDIAVDIGKVSGEQKGPQTIFFSSSGIQNLSFFSNNLWKFEMDNDANSNIDDAMLIIG